MKKINILLVLLLILVSVSAVSATDDANEANIGSNQVSDGAVDPSLNQGVDDYEDTLSVDDEAFQMGASSYTITESNYNQYFDLKGNLVSSNVKEGDTINLDGSFSSKNFTFNKKVNIVGTSTNKMKNSIVTLSSGTSGSSIKNLNIENKADKTYGIFLNSASNCIIQGCNIVNTGMSSYCICIANTANNNHVFNNYLKAYGITYGHGSFTRSTPPLIISGSHYNEVYNNHIEADDANGIYLSSYSGGPSNGGDSNFNTIFNNTVHYNVLPTSWAYGIQVMGSKNTIDSNTVIGGYRGVSTSGSGNVIINNKIINLTGADYNHPGVETGGEYGIVAAYNSVVRNNEVIGAKVISTGAGISAIDNSVVENNFVNVTLKGRGIVAGGSNVIIRNNVVFTELGSGIYQKDEGTGLWVEKNNITSDKGVGILIERVSPKRMPSNVTVINNIIVTNNDYAIDASGVQEDTSNIDEVSNIVYGKLINTPAGVIDTSKPTYIYKGKVLQVSPSDIRRYIDYNGGLTSEVNDGDILEFIGTFYNEVIYITKGIKITGKHPVFYNTTFKVTSGNVLIENLTIINNEAERVNAWGIFVNQANGVRIQNNNIQVSDPKAAYAVYVLDSVEVEVLDNTLMSQGDFLTFTLLSYESEDCSFIGNTIKTVGTGNPYKFSPEKCIDGNELVIDGRSYCIDGNELVIDGRSYCIDGNELVIDGRSYCIDGEELVIDGVPYSINKTGITINGTYYCIDGEELVIDGRSYCIDGNELVIDGRSYCIDGEELVINGTSYGSSYSTSNAHVVPEIYQTYGILLLYSSNNVVSGNNVNVTSKLNETYSVIGNDSSQNSVVGIDLYFNSHNNVFSNNNVFVKSNDNYIYGMGVLGYLTGHSAPVGNGATNNKFIGNEITLEGNYCAEGIIIGDESEDTLIENNIIHVKSAVSYGIYFEMSQKSNVYSNALTLNSEVVYGILGYNSSDNKVSRNNITGIGKYVYGIAFSNGKNNLVQYNIVFTNASGENITIKNLDSLGYGNAGIYLMFESRDNKVESNSVKSILGYGIKADGKAVNNIISDNYVDCEMGSGDAGVNCSAENTILYNYKYVANPPAISVSAIEYLGDGEFNLTFDDEFNGATVKFYNMENEVVGQSIISNGSAIFKTAFDYSYTPAEYIFKAQLFKENYKASIFEIPFTIEKANPVVVAEPISIIQGDTQTVSLKVVDSLGNPIKGANVKFIMIRAREVVMGTGVSGSDGVAKISYELPASVEVGNYDIRAEISGLSNFNDINEIVNITVLPRLGVIITIYPNTYIKSPVAIIKDSNGDKVANKKVSIKIGTVTYAVSTDNNGVIVLPDSIKSGSYSLSVTSQAWGKYCENTSTSNVLVVTPITGGGDYSVYYGNTIKYKVRVFNSDGKVAAGKAVTFKVNGKYVNVQADGSGYATYSVKLGVGKYTITASFAGFSISNKITINPTLSAKNIVKKKAKKIKFSAKLVNKNGKAFKNKKITFKIKGKKYKAKTNKKGVATVTLKNLKAGKYTITSSYGGCTIKNTIKIKK